LWDRTCPLFHALKEKVWRSHFEPLSFGLGRVGFMRFIVFLNFQTSSFISGKFSGAMENSQRAVLVSMPFHFHPGTS
jgi:hypothetical protein